MSGIEKIERKAKLSLDEMFDKQESGNPDIRKGGLPDVRSEDRPDGRTEVANHVPVNVRIFGANEHESHYVFDVLYNTTTDIQPTIHSTDTHGANQVNFAILSPFGYQFAPRYRDIRNKTDTLYGFKNPGDYDEKFLLKPTSKANTRLIIEEEDNIQHIFASLALKVTSQSVIIGKLSAYARKNHTKKALWELDNIRRSSYLLTYVDSLAMRRNVQRALNRGESYHYTDLTHLYKPL